MDMDAQNCTSSKRLLREIGEAHADPRAGIKLDMSEQSIYIWNAEVLGPAGTPYEGGLFKFTIHFSKDYPFVAPKVKCTTKIFHCNINTFGDICLDLLKHKWNPLLTAASLMLSIQQLLAEPNPEDPLMPSIATMLKSNSVEHNRRAKLFTERFAKSQK